MSDSDNVANGIAIIGMNCRFPRARNVDQFWQNLRDGVECISYFTDQELLAAGVDPALLKNPKFVRAKGVIDDVDMFDAAFFNIPPKEAEVIDPQQRILLECAWEALEGAGYSTDNYDGLIAVFAGIGPNHYISNVQANRERVESLGWYKLAIGNEKDHVTMRVSYALDLRGPSFNVQSACSTSLIAVHLGCQGLLDYQFDMALAGGATVNVKSSGGYVYSDGISAPDGHCRAFDARGKGLVSGNGAGIVVLKRLADALADGDSLTVGRDPDCDLCVDMRLASRRHCTIERRGDKLLLRDHSTNGTFITVDGGREARIRAEEIVLHGRGWLSFGVSRLLAEELVQFRCE